MTGLYAVGYLPKFGLCALIFVYAGRFYNLESQFVVVGVYDDVVAFAELTYERLEQMFWLNGRVSIFLGQVLSFDNGFLRK